MPPHSESGLSDIVRDWKIETEVCNEYITHIFYESGSSARERHIRKEEQWKRQKVLGEGGYGRVYLEKCVQGDKQDKLRAVKEIKSQDFKYSRELDAIIKFSHYKVCILCRNRQRWLSVVISALRTDLIVCALLCTIFWMV